VVGRGEGLTKKMGILLYNAEVWGVYIKNDFNNWDKLPVEKVHLKFCKIYTDVGRKTASRSELGNIH
jgi:hypothetical protein